MKAINYAPKRYAGSDMESIASVINIGFILLPSFLLVVLTRQLIQGDYDLTIVVSISILFSLLTRKQFLNGHLRSSVVSVTLFFTVLLTIVCTMGNGIHDIGMIGYPIIIGFSGIILDQKKLALASTLSILGVVWLVVGEQLGLYAPIPLSTGNEGDFIITSLLIVIGGFVAFGLTNNMKSSFMSMQKEISVSRQDAKKHADEVEKKLEIIEEIHRTVINSLSHIQHLIEHKQKSSSELLPVYQGLKRKVLVIEVAHKILLSAQAPIMLDIRELTQKILAEYEPKLNTKIVHLDICNESLMVRLDLAINYGICLLELINEADQPGNKEMRVRLSIEKKCVELKINGLQIENNRESGIVMNLLTKQLKGDLKRSKSELSLSFIPDQK